MDEMRRIAKNFLTMVLFALAMLPLVVPIKLHLAEYYLKTTSGLLKSTDNYFDESSGFISGCWDGPTGGHSWGNIYGLKIGSWMFRFDFYRYDGGEL